MNNFTVILSLVLWLPLLVFADNDEGAVPTTIEIKAGKLIREKHEIEIYDYHTGTFQAVDVYRKSADLEKPSLKPKPKANDANPQ